MDACLFSFEQLKMIMRKQFIILVLIALLAGCKCKAQFFSPGDTTITFKSQEGRVLAGSEVQELMKGLFSIRQEMVNGKKVITILPTSSKENIEQDKELALFRERLLDKPLPAFYFTTPDGGKLDPEALKGKLLVLNFWFTGCKPCITEIPHLNRLVEENKGNPVTFIAPAPETESQIRKFLKRYPFGYTIIPSSLDYINELKVQNFPTHMVVDKEGIVRQVFIGYADDIKEKLQAEIDKLLK